MILIRAVNGYVAEKAYATMMLKLDGIVLSTVVMFPMVAWSQGRPPLPPVDVAVTGVRDGTGHVRAALCTRETFPGTDCPFHVASPAQAGTTTLRIDSVPPGTYALEVFHDDDDSGQMEYSILGIPKKGIGFSGDKMPLFGPPSFAAAAVPVGASGARIVVRLHYY